MRRIILTGIILAAALLLSGCSYSADFVIVNKTGMVLDIQYRTANEGIYTVRLQVKTLEEFEKADGSWHSFPTDRLSTGENFSSGDVRLNPGEALLLLSKDIRDIKDEPKFKSSIESLTIKNDNGSVRYEGEQIFGQFEPGRYAWFPSSYTLYTLTYQ